MTEFWKRPKFWIGAIIALWLAYVIYANSQPAPVQIHLIPWFVTLQLKLSAIIIGGGILGASLIERFTEPSSGAREPGRPQRKAMTHASAR